MTARDCSGRRGLDDDDEIDRLLDGLDLPDVGSDAQHDGLGPQLADLDEWGE